VGGRDVALTLDATKAVFAALRGHPEELHMQCNVCFAIGCIAHSCREGQVATVAAGGLDAALAALRAPSDEGAVQASCGAIAGMCHLVIDRPSSSAEQAKAAAAGCIEAVVGAMQRHPANVELQEQASLALASMAACNARNQVRAALAGAPAALVAALRLAHHASFSAYRCRLLIEACLALHFLAWQNEFAHKKVILAGALEALEATLTTRLRTDSDRLDVLDPCYYALLILLPGHEARAVCAGVADAASPHALLTAVPVIQRAAVRALKLLQAAVDQHDRSPAACAYDSCVRCAGLRASGAICALPGCGARTRADNSGKKLLRCGGCRAAVFCGAAHQREDWAGRHEAECRMLREQQMQLATVAGGSSAD
jgi:hypothetical protein